MSALAAQPLLASGPGRRADFAPDLTLDWIIESIRFPSQELLVRAAHNVRVESPHALLLEAVIAAHVPELVVIESRTPAAFRFQELHSRSRTRHENGTATPVDLVFELRRYESARSSVEMAGSPIAPELQARFADAASVHKYAELFVFDSFEARHSAWRAEKPGASSLSYAPSYAPNYEVGFYRYLCIGV